MRSHPNLLSNLKSRWKSLLQPFQVEEKIAEEVWLDLVEAYSSDGRFYHTLEHIQQVLAVIDELRSLSQNPAAIEFAAWFHDVIYEPRANDNEERSAEYAADILNKIGMKLEIINTVKQLILKTKKHQDGNNNIDSQILLDADLSILGSSDWKYQAYTVAIRKEYAWVPDEQYKIGRQQVLQTFLQRPKIYLTEKIFLALENKARHNIQTEINNYII